MLINNTLQKEKKDEILKLINEARYGKRIYDKRMNKRDIIQ